jgi:hypothetical protein
MLVNPSDYQYFPILQPLFRSRHTGPNLFHSGTESLILPEEIRLCQPLPFSIEDHCCQQQHKGNTQDQHQVNDCLHVVFLSPTGVAKVIVHVKSMFSVRAHIQQARVEVPGTLRFIGGEVCCRLAPAQRSH